MVNTPPKPWSRIMKSFPSPLQDFEITTDFSTSPEVIAEIKGLIPVFDRVIADKLNSLGYNGVSPITLPKTVREGELSAAIKSDMEWRQAFERLAKVLAPGLDLEQILSDKDAIPRPDWNSEQFGLLAYEHNPDTGLHVKGQYSHSYFDMISQAKNSDGKSAKYPVLKLDPLSVVGVLFSSEGYLVLGYRGGHNFADTVMNLPAGSAEPHSCANPLAESLFDKELPEETGLHRDDINRRYSGLIGITEDYASTAKRSYAVFELNSNLSFRELNSLWQSSARDRNEHRRLLIYPDDEDFLIDVINSQRFNYDPASLPLANTVPENHDVWLPQCAVNVLTSYVGNLGQDWAKKAELELEGFYDLTSCFKE